MAEQPNFGGAITVHSTVRAGTPIIAVRPNAIAAEPSQGTATSRPCRSPRPTRRRRTDHRPRARRRSGERPDLTEAQIVVSGGRGTGSAEGFGIIE